MTKQIANTFRLILLLSILGAYLPVSAQTAAAQEKPKLSAFKTAPLGPMIGNWGITYERGQLIKENISLEVNAGYTTTPLLFRGVFNDVDAGMSGFYLSAGPKIYFGQQEFYIPGMVRTHPMFGWYFKPELGARHVVYSSDSSSDVKATAVKLLFNVGKQWISNNFVFEIYAGAGYAYRDYQGEGDFLNEVKDLVNENFPIAGQTGIRMGFLSK